MMNDEDHAGAESSVNHYLSCGSVFPPGSMSSQQPLVESMKSPIGKGNSDAWRSESRFQHSQSLCNHPPFPLSQGLSYPIQECEEEVKN